MRPFIEQSNDLAPSLPFRSWLDCTTNTAGYNFRKGQAVRSYGLPSASEFTLPNYPFSLTPGRLLLVNSTTCVL
jgi:hypothetical protein